MQRSSYRSGFRPPSRAGAERRSPPDRRAWLAMLNEAQLVADDPDQTTHALGASLKGLTAESFPVGVSDVRRKWAKAFLEQARLYADGGTGTRTQFRTVIRESVAALRDILIDVGANEAAQSRARMGFKED